jgi:hypothetical protein
MPKVRGVSRKIPESVILKRKLRHYGMKGKQAEKYGMTIKGINSGAFG